MSDGKVQRGKAAHREPHNMRGPIGDRAHHVSEIFGRTDLVIGLQVGWHIGRRIAARAIRCAAIMTGKKIDLRVPAVDLPRKLVHESDARATCDRSNMKPDAVGGGDHHSGPRAGFRLAASRSGWCSRKASADSTSRAKANTSTSLPNGPTICTATGMPSGARPHGSEIAG